MVSMAVFVAFTLATRVPEAPYEGEGRWECKICVII